MMTDPRAVAKWLEDAYDIIEALINSMDAPPAAAIELLRKKRMAELTESLGWLVNFILMQKYDSVLKILKNMVFWQLTDSSRDQLEKLIYRLDIRFSRLGDTLRERLQRRMTDIRAHGAEIRSYSGGDHDDLMIYDTHASHHRELMRRLTPELRVRASIFIRENYTSQEQTISHMLDVFPVAHDMFESVMSQLTPDEQDDIVAAIENSYGW